MIRDSHGLHPAQKIGGLLPSAGAGSDRIVAILQKVAVLRKGMLNEQVFASVEDEHTGIMADYCSLRC